MSMYNIVLSTSESTVVTEYQPQQRRSETYQSEAQLEAGFIKMLTGQGYEYANIHSSAELVSNLRIQLEKLNNISFSDKEWTRFFNDNLANANEGIVEKTRKIQEDFVQVLKRDDGTSKNILLIDKKNIHNNFVQVLNQYTEKEGKHDNRYDVTILVNGFPLVHVELKARGVPLKQAFDQIDRYQRESFWAASGLYEYVHVFVISNGTRTKYYSNTTRLNAVNERKAKGSGKKTSNSFEFTSFWADSKNKIIPDIVDFTKTFFSKHTILNILTKYCVFTAEEMLLVMRPYQIVATEKILNKIVISSNYKKTGSLEAGGYIWHTTGSGKTLTSFKTAQLATKLDFIDNVLFVVDRKDLDYQTMKEYEKFQKGAANSNKNTAILQRQLEDTTSRIIVTTIQKLSEFVKRNKTHSAYNKHVVIIFDECHRSQFGDMHAMIVKAFKNYHLFGFTGTPIMAINSSSNARVDARTTRQTFGEKLHTYTIVDAINDGNVLPFRIDYINTMKKKDNINDKQVASIDTEEALGSHERISEIVSYIIEHFDQKTYRNVHYNLKGKRVSGFNSMFAVSSIPMAKKYYLEFKKQLAEKNNPMTIATIFSFAPNESNDGIMEDESFETELLDKTSREFLDDVIADFNKTFKTNHDSSSKGFENYYKELSQKVKNREIDLVIVVNMFLTGFDATTLNTLWVDKNLRMHGLIQAFSRTNRILNSVKKFGNIVCFRDLQAETNEAIALFGDENAEGIVLLKAYEDYYYGYTGDDGKKQKGYEERIAELVQKYPLSERIVGDSNKRDFVTLFSSILRLRNILSAFDKFDGMEILSPRDFQDYTGLYVDLHQELRPAKGEKASVVDDIVFEMELIKQIEVNIDYILNLVAQYHASNCQNKEILISIGKAVKSSLELRSKAQLVDNFINMINTLPDDANINKSWTEYVKQKMDEDLDALIKEEGLKEKETKDFIENAFRMGSINTTGTDIGKLMPPMSLFGGGKENRTEKKLRIIEKLLDFFNTYNGTGVK